MTISVFACAVVLFGSSLKHDRIEEGVRVITVMRQQHGHVDAELRLQRLSHESSMFQTKLKRNTRCFMEDKGGKTANTEKDGQRRRKTRAWRMKKRRTDSGKET